MNFAINRREYVHQLCRVALVLLISVILVILENIYLSPHFTLSSTYRAEAKRQDTVEALTDRLSKKANEKLDSRNIELSKSVRDNLDEFLAQGARKLASDRATDKQISQAESNIENFIDELIKRSARRSTNPVIEGVGGEDLSGTYTGTVKFPAKGLEGEAKLTISGQQFTLSTETGTFTGRITTTTTRSYKSAALQFSTSEDQHEPPLVVSARVRQQDNRISLTPVPGAYRSFSFVSDSESAQVTNATLNNTRTAVCPLYPFC